MKKFISILAMLLVVSCNSYNDMPATEVSSMSSISNQSVNLFKNDNANEHHRLMREFAQNFDSELLIEMVENNVPQEQIYQAILGDYYDLFNDMNSFISFNQSKPSSESIELGKMMNKGASLKDLLNYMDKNNCRTEFNETMISSYIVFMQEDNWDEIIPLNDVNWTGVGVVDGWGVALGGPVAGVAASSGVVTGVIIRQIVNS